MIDAGQLRIGPVAYPVRTQEGVAVAYSDPAYQSFWRSAGSTGDALAVLPVTFAHGKQTIPAGHPVYAGGRNWAIWQDGKDMIFCSGFHEQACAQYFCRVDRALTAATVYADPDRDTSATPLRYPLDQFLSWGLLGRCGGFILHGAVAVKDGMGWVFTGRSGAGKSTISGLLHAAGWRILNDDRVIIYPREGRLRVAGTPWHGSGRFAEDAEVDLAGICFIHKSTVNQVVSTTSGEAKMAMLDVAAIPWFEDDWSTPALHALDYVAAQASFFHLHFTRSPVAAEVFESFACGEVTR